MPSPFPGMNPYLEHEDAWHNFHVQFPSAVVAALNAPQLGTGPDRTSPVVYRLDMSDANSYFLAQRFPVEDKDIIYVANARLNELQKFFTLLNTLTGPVITGIVVKNAAP